MNNPIRVLMLDDDNHTPSYHAEDTTYWHDANHFIKWLITSRSMFITYEVRQVRLIDLDIDLSETDPDIDIERMFDIVDYNGRGYSYEEYLEAFDILWKNSEAI